MSYNAEMNLAKEAVMAAGNYLKEQVRANVKSCSGKDVKLENDIVSEEIIIEKLSQTGISILSEERGLINNSSKTLKWIVDPIDGSVNYQRGLRDLSCVSIALWDGDTPVLGVVNRFEKNEMFTGIRGKGAYYNDVIMKPSRMIKVEDSILATGFPIKRNYEDESLKKSINMIQQFKKIRMLGSAALMGVYVAMGRFDAYVEEGIYIWDVAASLAILEAAGGVGKIKMINNEQCLCELFSTKELFEDYLRMIG